MAIRNITEIRAGNTVTFTPVPEDKVQWRHTKPNGIAAYAPPKDGPFHCVDCEYLTPKGCEKPEVIKEFKILRLIPGSAKLAPVKDASCCNYFEKA